MKDIIVFIPSEIDAKLHSNIMDFLIRNDIKTTNNIAEASVIITKEKPEKTLENILGQLKPEICELQLAYPIEWPIIQKAKTKHFVQKNIDIKRFNKFKHSYKQIILNRKRHR